LWCEAQSALPWREAWRAGQKKVLWQQRKDVDVAALIDFVCRGIDERGRG
jgi:hypothetical protein